jgi:hypothetical protein
LASYYNFREYIFLGCTWFTKFRSEISHSITCSTALHAVLNGCMVEIRMIDKFMVGGSET